MEKGTDMAEQETMSTVENGASTVGDAAAAAEVVASQEETASGEQQAAASASAGTEGQKPAQSRVDNAQYKGLRQKAEALEGFQGQVMALARAKGLQPKDASEAMTMLQAEAAGKTHEDYLREQAETEAALEARVKGLPEYQSLKADAEAYRLQKAMADDLAAIRAVDPSVTSLEQLGEEYGELIQRMSGLDAYYYLKGKGAVRDAAMPPATGEVGGNSNADRDFSSEELDRLNYDDLVKDDKLYQKAMRSMLGLGKR